MENHHFLYAALGVFCLLTLATIIHALCKRFKVPFAVGLLFSGLGLSLIVEKFDWPWFEYIAFSPEIIFYVFLPTLIFESAYHLDFRHFRGVLREVSIMATLGLCISIWIIGAGLHYALGLPWVVSLLFGSLISATDPVAVLAIFKEMKVPRKLNTMVDGESLINDGTALVIFQYFFGLAVVGGLVTFSPTLVAIESLKLIQSVCLGILVGALMGGVFSYAIAHSQNKGVQLTLSLVLAHMTFLVAEGLLSVSGILATLTAGLLVGNFGKRKLKPESLRSFKEIWAFLGFVSNALVFMLLGLKLGSIGFIENLVPIVLAIALTVFLARPLSVCVSFLVNNRFVAKPQRTGVDAQLILIWAGIRGALAAAAVLLLPESFEYAEVLQAMTAGVIIATFFLNAMTLPLLLKYLKVNKLSRKEEFHQTEAELVINEEVCHYLDSLLKRKYVSKTIHKKLKHQYMAEHEQVIKKLKGLEKRLGNNARELEKMFTHFALGIELQTYRKLFAQEEITEERFVVLRESINRQIDRLERDTLPDERQPSHKYAPEVSEECSVSRIYKFLGLKSWAKKVCKSHKHQKIISRLQHYRARRIASWKVVKNFESLVEDHPVFKKSPVVQKIIDRYKKWNENAEFKMQMLEKEYPQIVIPHRTYVTEKACLEQMKYIEKKFFEKGFISEKIYENLEGEIQERSQKLHK